MALRALLLVLLAAPLAAQTTHFRHVDPFAPGVGWAVRALGDVDLDGVADVAVGDYRYDCGFAGCGAGPSRVSVLSGTDGAVIYDLDPTTFDGFGHSLDVVGDLDADGRADFVVGAPHFGGPVQSDGRVLVLSGASGAVLHTLPAPAPAALFGSTVAGLGDVDADGTLDFAAASVADVRVFSGANAAPLFVVGSPVQVPLLSTVARYEDFDGDARADFLVGFVEGAGGFSGFAQVRSGANGSVLRDFAVAGFEPTFGYAVSSAGDADLDGRLDVIVGAPQIDFGSGSTGFGFASVFSATGALIRQFNGVAGGAHLGMAVSGGRDVDGDGRSDVAVATTCEPGVPNCLREATAYSGANGAPLFTLVSSFTGQFGVALDFVGDLNGDGRSELAFGSACSDPFADCGELRVVTLATGAPANYCTSGTSSQGCTPSMGSIGVPSASAASGFTLQATGVEGARAGMIFYGVSGRVVVPWGTGSSFLCVKAPVQRLGLQNSGGSAGLCDGALAIDFLAFVAAHPAALGAPLSAGDVIDAQAWYRDPPSPKSTSLSDALEFALLP